MGNIFDKHYFEDFEDEAYDVYDATEATALKKGLVGLFTGPLGILIGNAVHNHRVKKSVVASLYDCTSAYGDKEGKAAYQKTLNFLKSNGFIAEDFDNETIKFTELSNEGKKFIHGYYSALDSIDKFSVERGKEVADKDNAEGNVSGVVTGAWLGSGIAKAVTYAIKHNVYAVAASAVGFSVGAVIGLIPSAINVADVVKSTKDHAKFKETMRTADESVSAELAEFLELSGALI